jgi:hypothetical protein
VEPELLALEEGLAVGELKRLARAQPTEKRTSDVP